MTDHAAHASGHGHAHEEFEHHVVPISTYLKVFWALMALLILTLIAASFPLGALNLPIAMVIAVVKALLVILFFMHVKYSSPLVKLTAASGVSWLLILFVLTLADYVSRGW